MFVAHREQSGLHSELNVPDPIAVGIDVIGVPWLAVLIKVGALTCLTSFILVFLYGQSRIFFTMAKDGLLPQVFQTVHPRFRTPHLGQVILGLVVGIPVVGPDCDPRVWTGNRICMNRCQMCPPAEDNKAIRCREFWILSDSFW